MNFYKKVHNIKKIHKFQKCSQIFRNFENCSQIKKNRNFKNY